jgi:hypothetical protein
MTRACRLTAGKDGEAGVAYGNGMAWRNDYGSGLVDYVITWSQLERFLGYVRNDKRAHRVCA